MKTLDRAGLLQRLLAVEPGVGRRDNRGQESGIRIKRSWLYTFNIEIGCAIGTLLEPEIDGVVEAKTLIAYLKTLTDPRIEIGEEESGVLTIRSREGQSRLPLMPEMRWPSLERPERWSRINGELAEAVNLVSKCTRKYRSKKDDWQKACVHLAPGWLEATDNIKMARYELPTFVEKPVLVRATTLREMIPLGFTEAGETANWLHLRNPLGLRMSLRKWEPEEYPDLSQTLQARGRRVTLPQGLKEAAKRAGIFADVGKEGKFVRVRVSKDGMELFAAAAGAGEHSGSRPIGSYAGAAMEFRVNPDLLAELAEQGITTIEVSPVSLRYQSGPYTYLTAFAAD